ncbi:class I SAM-dependent methyltransferase, partial [Candidatus Micrarchaeota archaeon]|nr:class I SAM-dependent methyltransferase [Candidatus Micrarchaeota archaeon]
PSTALKFFLPLAKGKVLDAGCGNGRNAEVLAETSEVCAIDVSPKMVSLAKKRLGKKAEVERADLKKLPFEDKAFDAVFCLAVLHHFSPKEQGKALKETERVLKKDGFLCLAVWNRCQKRFRNKPKELNVPWGEHERYYYLFDETELIALLEKNGFRTTELFYEKNGRKEEREKAQNLCVAAKKR